jgi:hypothetical protein
MLLGRSGWAREPSEFSEPVAVRGLEVRMAASAELQPERRPARRPARPREATLKRLRRVREVGRKDMS